LRAREISNIHTTNGHIANDPRLAVRYFLNALEKIPSLIEKYERENEKISSDLPVLQEIVRSTWRRENELKDLKTELAALDRKIQLSLNPLDTGEDSSQKNSVKNENEVQKAVREIHDLMSGKLKINDFTGNCGNTDLQTNQSKRFKL
jgi:hypothetical protein